ncbi:MULTISPECIES: recombinase family protein [unclassified Paenibacillus]|uniref:recombinase family protein n=1 Tax=unclassified Paenibacillus TaxID=185978 RepID=UPI001AEB2F65|nr:MULTISPECIES: recombinase family protein [unclassified Paenibacillus]MBP1154480.1 site-specific DNA recombinase [Paenibacillus sp. PvP091]MBP1170136.1 site-specific DNA recombinase [Paenibacillus sp. PvR098]MBP2441164.1 site-specific DNA recombinase [Paenibacillus sp. PvP052]
MDGKTGKLNSDNLRYVALYCRVSTDEQAREGVSLEEQQERLKAYCRAMGWTDQFQIFIDDGYSAKNLERPALTRLLQAVKSGNVTRIMVTKLDRMSRRLLDLLNLIDLFQDFEVSFVSISESFDTNTPSGRLTLQVLGAVAEFERERIRERVFENMLHAASTGKWLTQSPYGYDLIDKSLVTNEKEAKIVKRVFELYLHQGNGFYSIAKLLNEEGIPSRHDKEWSIRSIKLMLTNPAYKGSMVWNRKDSSKSKRKEKDDSEWVIVEDCLPVIIDKPTWEAVQKRLAQTKMAPRAQTSLHLLGGLIRCGNCGSGMSIGYSGSQNHRYRVYRCSANKNKGTCTSKQYRADDVENWFKEGLSLLSWDNSGILRMTAADPSAKSEREQLEQKVKTAKARYKRKVEAYTAGFIELTDLNEEKERLEQIISEMKMADRGERDPIDIELLQNELNDKIYNMISAIEFMPVEQAKAIIQTFIRYVIIHGIEDIEIRLRSL